MRYYGKWMRDEAEKRIGHLYPKVQITEAMAADRPDLEKYVGRELTVIAWLWARTVASPNPAARGAHVPLMGSFNLSTKKGARYWLRPRSTAGGVLFDVTPTADDERKRAAAGTISKRAGTCLLTESAIDLDHVRLEGKRGRLGRQMTAIVCKGKSERVFLPSSDADLEAANPPNGIGPHTPLPEGGLGFRVQAYGLRSHINLFTPRHLETFEVFRLVLGELRAKAMAAGAQEPHLNAVADYLAICLSKCADYWSNLCIWRSDPKNLGIGHIFARNALQMVWDYAETNPFSGSSGSWDVQLDWVARYLEMYRQAGPGLARRKSATELRNGHGHAVSTDPPYYDSIGYADLSDVFYVWQRLTFQDRFGDLTAPVLTPKRDEIIADPSRHGGSMSKAKAFFEERLEIAIGRMREVQKHDLPLTIYYAFKQAEQSEEGTVSTGWETILNALVRQGFVIGGTWPISTESVNRLRNRDSNALASSIVLVCRIRPDDAPTSTRREFKRLLDAELPDALAHLRAGGIAPVDLAQAAIGPGMAVFTRHAKVLESDGTAMTVRTALGLINEVLDASLAEAEGDFDRDTRWAVAWFEQHGPAEGPYGDAETLSNAKNTSVDGLVRAGVITSRAGKVRLLPRPQLPEGWSPATDDRLTVWESCQHLIRRLEADGEQSAAALLAELGPVADKARDLAYRLYSLSERKKLSAEGRAYNGLITAWPELSRLSREVRRERQTQGSLLAD